MGQRSRKRGRRGPPAAIRSAAAPKPEEQPAAKVETMAASPAAGAPKPTRTEERNAAVRATLRPLEPGERPRAVQVAAAVALLFALANVVLVLIAYHPSIGGQHTTIGGEILYIVLMLACAGGMWQLRYWALLGFMVILLITVLAASLALIRASNLLGVAVPLVVISGGGWLFYKLVRALSRIQMPKYPGR